MSRNYDNWERLVAAVIKRQQLWELFHAHSRTPSVLSDATDFSSISTFEDVPFGYSVSVDETKNSGLVFVSNYRPIVHLEVLLGASFEILGEGTFTSVRAYKLNYGTTIVVKRLNMVDNISERDFMKHMGMIGAVKHENVAELRAYYYSKEEKLIICDYHSAGSVFALLHGKPGENRAKVDWETRLKIAIGTARGISYIHTRPGGNMVHGNIKSSNIFLNSQCYAIVSDTGLASMIPTTPLQYSRCYAPEVKTTRDVSQESDVYSFGILLLELLIRKSPDPSLGHKAVDLVKLVNSVSRKEWKIRVFDGDLLSTPRIRKEIVRMLEIGISCVAKYPEKRPKMSAVAKMLENRGMRIGNEVSIQTETDRLVFLGDGNPRFDLEDLLRASTEVHGNGTFGESYKAILKNGIIIFVKRLKEVIVTNREFQQHMEIVGRMGHKNVVNLVAYYYFRDKKLLVYDYYDQGSLSTTLHGNKRALDWTMRLNIALAAAKGIAHIHTKNGKKLVHGNISASNILINQQQFGIVSDVGLGKLAYPTTSFIEHNAGYSAPEVTDNRNVSQASDVYSFGIVLLELLTGQPPQTTYYGEAMPLLRWTQTVLMDEGTIFDAEISRFEDVDSGVGQVMQIARRCVASVPQGRPKMANIVKMLEKIRDTVTARHRNSPSVLLNASDFSSSSSSYNNLQQRQVNKSKKTPGLVFIPQFDPIFDLKDLFRASHQVLEKGTFGTSYKATLENGIVVYVKRLEDVIVTNEEFQQHMEVIGRIGHKNVAEVKAYYYSREKKLLVYHYYSQGSLSARLYGDKDSGQRPMKWNMRLKIAVYAARGIAHIHTKNGHNLVHGNIRPSNILLYNQQYGIVSDVGLGKLVSPSTLFVTRGAGYCAPEVTNSRKVSQASDVYSFGIILLELLSGKPPDTIILQREFMTLVTWFESFVIDGLANSVFDAEVWRSGEVNMEMMEMRKIAMYCVARLPERRPKMTDIVKMLEEIGRL